MLARTKYERAFSTPLVRFELDDSAALNADLLSAGMAMRAESEGANKSNRGGWHSSGNLFGEKHDCFQTLRKAAEEAVWQATLSVGAKVDIDTLDMKLFAWMNMNPTGGFNAPHTHPGAHWSGVYYVHQPESGSDTAGMIEFMDPRSDLPNWRILKAPCFRLKKKLRPKAGEMILFPSYLLHWVYPNESGDERVSIAFNATFRKA